MIAPAAALASLRGLALGDAFGDQYFLRDNRGAEAIAERWLAPSPLRWTDDTNMALSIFQVLMTYGEIRRDELARSFVEKYDPARGYGPSMHRVLREIGDGRPWAEVTREQFGGQGSHGNGAAMRVAPLGAWLADRQDVIGQATASALVTHAHPEAVAGAVAVAVATRARCDGATGTDLLREAAAAVPDTEVASRIGRALGVRLEAGVEHAVAVLGNGVHLSAIDTVPFALWSVAVSTDDYEDCLWRTVSGLGDRDTTCAIAGGVFAAAQSVTLPVSWLADAEPLPTWTSA